jgi:23S rRNA (cytosine1962-C5)-methyltransferase
MIALKAEGWKDYELIDCGGFEKLERFGKYVLIRPEPQAIWNKRLSEDEWVKLANARYQREKQKKAYRFADEENGGWTFFRKMPESWTISYELGPTKLQFKLNLTTFGHIGVFPEQAENWKYIAANVKKAGAGCKVLNLFAYTGGASLAAKAAGADVTHVDAVKNVITWARENMELTGLQDIRWLVEDALKFVQREVKRGKKYQGIILDPPAYGRGPSGEKWVLEESFNELMNLCSQLLAGKGSFLVLNLYSMGFSSLIGNNVVESYLKPAEKQFGEFYLQSRTGIQLPLGTFMRLTI